MSAKSNADKNIHMEANSQKIKLKLVIDNQRDKVLFAEADSSFVDFLFYTLSLPLSAVGAYLRDAGPGSIDKLRQSVGKLDEGRYIQHQATSSASSILAPHLLTHVPFLPRLTDEINKPVAKFIYHCPDYGSHTHIYSVGSDMEKSRCCWCSREKTTKMEFSDSSLQTRPAKYVNDMVKYMVTDELSVSPLDSTSVIDAIKGCDVIMEKCVEFGPPQALEMLKAVVLQSDKVLTSVLLQPK
ncbi:unnamed protein product [Linum tenue]|uniref:Uncharacterized protein n=1 Tax=Linum tenue TaxID=586396 RepID=A0AAV0JNA1_9ROSI|nr:unnamed protein product [Linum tenue]